VAVGFVLAVALFGLQPQPWNIGVRIGLAVLPAVILTGAIAFLFLRFLHLLHRTRVVKRRSGLFLSIAACMSWVALLLDIGPQFLSWVLIFSSVLVFLVLTDRRYSVIFSLAMIIFSVFYGAFRLHQAEQLLYLGFLLKHEQQKQDHILTTQIVDSTAILSWQLSEPKIPVAWLPIVDQLQAKTDFDKDTGSQGGFFGLQPTIVISPDKDDETAIPMLAVLVVPNDFSATLWNMQIESSLESLYRKGRIGQPAKTQRDLQCTVSQRQCKETMWMYDDKFLAETMQLGYTILQIQVAVGETTLPLQFMIWFREPYSDGLPHQPSLLQIMKGIKFNEAEATEDLMHHRESQAPRSKDEDANL